MTRTASIRSRFLIVLMFIAVVSPPTGSAQQTAAGQPPAIRSLLPLSPVPLTLIGNLSAPRGRDPRLKNSAVSEQTTSIFLPASTYLTAGGLFDDNAMVIADLIGNGIPDIVVANGGVLANGDGSVAVFLGNGDGTFQSASLYDAGGSDSTSVAVADVNGDGEPDLIVTSICATSASCSGSGVVGILLGNGDGTFQPVVTYSTAAYGFNELAVADLNHDGTPDLIVASNCLVSTSPCPGDGAVSVLLGKGDGTFQTAVVYDSGASGTSSVTAVDLTGNGTPDVVVVNLDGNGYAGVLLGNGNGTLQQVVSYNAGCAWPQSSVVADVNGDGKPDIEIACITYAGVDDGWVSVLLNNGNGTFEPAAVYSSFGKWPSSLVVADFNNDGLPDIAAANYGSDNVGLLLNNGNGTFRQGISNASGQSGLGDVAMITAADINGDGNLDILVTNNPCSGFCSSSVGLLLGHGDGTFQPVQTYPAGGGVSNPFVADLNNDGKPDVVTLNMCADSNCEGGVGVLMNNTVRPFNPTTTTLVSSANPTNQNQVVTYTATITSNNGGAVSGTVTFTDRALRAGLNVVTVPITNNQASYVATYKLKSTHNVTAGYSGDADNGFSTSGPLSELVWSLPVDSHTTLTTSGSPSIVGQPVTFTATVTWKYGSVPNGELVAFYDGKTEMGTCTTTAGLATFTTSDLTAKRHGIKAIYPGDGTFKPSDGWVQQVVNK